MDAPPATENNLQFRKLSALFRTHDVPVPAVEAFDDRGFLLVTDFGDRPFSTAYAQGDREGALELAIGALLRIQAIPPEAVPPYTAQRLRDELEVTKQFNTKLILAFFWLALTLRVQVPNNHILSQILTYITTILNPST